MPVKAVQESSCLAAPLALHATEALHVFEAVPDAVRRQQDPATSARDLNLYIQVSLQTQVSLPPLINLYHSGSSSK